MKRFHSLAALALVIVGITTAKALPVVVQEVGIGANQVVTISTSTTPVLPGAIVPGNYNVYAGVVKLIVDGVATDGFCIDPWHWSISGPQNYTLESLESAPKPPGPMDADTAKKIKQIWQQYYTPGISNSVAAGLQIAIWKLVDLSVGGGDFGLISGDDYGANAIINWVNANPGAAIASLVAVTGPGQDFVISGSVPDAASTALLLGLALMSLVLAKRSSAPRLARVK